VIEMEDGIKRLKEEVDIIDDSDVSSLLYLFREISNYKYSLGVLDQAIKDKIRVYMKERKWDRYKDPETKIGVSITKITRKHYDDKELERILNKAEMAQVIVMQVTERMDIITPESKKRMKKFVRGK